MALLIVIDRAPCMKGSTKEGWLDVSKDQFVKESKKGKVFREVPNAAFWAKDTDKRYHLAGDNERAEYEKGSRKPKQPKNEAKINEKSVA